MTSVSGFGWSYPAADVQTSTRDQVCRASARFARSQTGPGHQKHASHCLVRAVAACHWHYQAPYRASKHAATRDLEDRAERPAALEARWCNTLVRVTSTLLALMEIFTNTFLGARHVEA